MTNLTLADGTVIDPTTGKPEVVTLSQQQEQTFIEVPNYADTQRQIVAARTRVADFPVPPRQMTSIGIILFYSMMGIDDSEIHSLTGLDEEQIGRIRISDTYSTIQQEFLDKIIKTDIDDVRHMFVEGSRAAAGKMIHLMNTSVSEGTQMAAAKDVLDRAGQRPSDVVEHRHSMENSLKIEIVKKDSLEDIPVINGDVL